MKISNNYTNQNFGMKITAPKSFWKSIENSEVINGEKVITPQSVKIYIEGDGHSFNAHGFPTSDPTPHSYFLREIAFADKNNQVTYLARPCQFHKDKK